MSDYYVVMITICMCSKKRMGNTSADFANAKYYFSDLLTCIAFNDANGSWLGLGVKETLIILMKFTYVEHHLLPRTTLFWKERALFLCGFNYTAVRFCQRRKTSKLKVKIVWVHSITLPNFLRFIVLYIVK